MYGKSGAPRAATFVPVRMQNLRQNNSTIDVPIVIISDQHDFYLKGNPFLKQKLLVRTGLFAADSRKFGGKFLTAPSEEIRLFTDKPPVATCSHADRN